jgi:hypothetical protein
MQLELRRVSPIRAANIVALLYGISMLVFAVPMFAVFSLVPEPPAADPQQPPMALSTFRWLLLAYPVFGLVFGWFGGLVGSYLYNAIAARLGGFKVEFTSIDSPSTAPAA